MRPPGRLAVVSVCLARLLAIVPAAGAGAPPCRELRLVMGTTAELRVSGLANPRAALDAGFEALARTDERLSLWKPSELQRLDDAGAGVLSAQGFRVLRHALEIAAASGGAFDPTVEPLVRAAGGFGDPPRALSAEERRALLARVGHARVRIDAATRGVRLGGTRVVLDGIAKGDAADEALAALRRAGARSGLVDLGGSSLAAFGEPLFVELRDPAGRGRPWAAFRAAEASVSSSGDDQKPGHILDPRSGRPASAVLQATVVASKGIEADALSTALFVLGAEAGLALVARRGAHGLVLLEVAGRRVVRTTPGFAARFALRAAPGVEVRD